MTKPLSLTLYLFVLVCATAAVAGGTPVQRDTSRYQIAVHGPGVVLSSNGSAGLSKARSDSFYVYGGPGSVVGMFQYLIEDSGGGCNPQGWTGHDLTEETPVWHVIPLDDSGGINDATLGASYAVAAHHDGVDYIGYGNNWSEWLLMEIDIDAVGISPQDQTVVDLHLDYSHDTEPAYDYFRVLYQSNDAYSSLLESDGSSYVDSSGVYANQSFAAQITYEGNDYNSGGTNGVIRLLLRQDSDGGFSDEDGLWPTQGRGAVAVDDIVVELNAAPYSVADWEDLGGGCGSGCVEGQITLHDNGATVGTAGWRPVPASFVGDFSKQFQYFEDIDPCRENESCQWTFIDDGSPPNNDPQQETTDGSTSSTWSYGIEDGYVVNYTGGLTDGIESLHNEVWSPEFDWDLPGAADDAANGGAVLMFSRWSHLPLINGIGATWSVRGFTTANGWADWEADLQYYNDDPVYENIKVDVTDKLPNGVERAQIALGVIDWAWLFDYPGTDATPAPLYDNVRVKKFVIPGPVISTRAVWLMSDGFPNDGTTTGSIRWDASVDLGIPADSIVPGDSLIADIVAVAPGTTIVDPVGGAGGTLHGAIVANPDFNSARLNGLASIGANLIGTVTDANDPKFGWEIFEFSVVGSQATTVSGVPIPDRYFWDLPDGAPNVNAPHQAGVDLPGTALFFPGDVIHYYLEASDDQPGTTTLPADISGFLDFTHDSLYSRSWTTRGLPSLQGGSQPSILWWNDFGHRGAEDEWGYAFRQNGLYEGEHYDTYTTKGPSSLVSNGLGTPGHHGANDAQLAGYDCLIYTSGDLGSGLISDGTDMGSNDKSNDIGVLEAWHNQQADRYHVYFGDDIVHGMMNAGPSAASYMQNIVGAKNANGDSDGDVSSEIDGQTAPVVMAPGFGFGTFDTDYVAYGGCLVLNDFDSIQASGPSVIIVHQFLDRNGLPYAPPVPASLYWARVEPLVGGFDKRTMVFAHDMMFAQDVLNTTSGARSVRADLLGEILDSFDKGGFGAPVGTDAVPSYRFAVEQNHPNPFNPTTTIKFTAPAKGEMVLRVFNVRGELVYRTTATVDPGPGEFKWNGRDLNGAAVSSGVYPYTVQGFGVSESSRMVLLK